MLSENDGSLCPIRDTGKVSDGVDNLLANKQWSDQNVVVGDKGTLASVFQLDQIKHRNADQSQLSTPG